MIVFSDSFSLQSATSSSTPYSLSSPRLPRLLQKRSKVSPMVLSVRFAPALIPRVLHSFTEVREATSISQIKQFTSKLKRHQVNFFLLQQTNQNRPLFINACFIFSGGKGFRGSSHEHRPRAAPNCGRRKISRRLRCRAGFLWWMLFLHP